MEWLLRLLKSDLPLATRGLPGERCFWISFPGPEYGNGGDCSCQAGEACRSSQERVESDYCMASIYGKCDQ